MIAIFQMRKSGRGWSCNQWESDVSGWEHVCPTPNCCELCCVIQVDVQDTNSALQGELKAQAGVPVGINQLLKQAELYRKDHTNIIRETQRRW